LLYFFCQSPDILSGCIAVIYQNQGLSLMNAGIAFSVTFQPGLLNEPASWNFYFVFRNNVMRGFRVSVDKFFKSKSVHHRIFKKTTAVTQLFRVGEFCTTYSNNRPAHVLNRWVVDLHTFQFFADIAVIGM